MEVSNLYDINPADMELCQSTIEERFQLEDATGQSLQSIQLSSIRLSSGT